MTRRRTDDTQHHLQFCASHQRVPQPAAAADVASSSSSSSSSATKAVSFHSVVGFRWTLNRFDIITEDLHYDNKDYARFRREEIFRRLEAVTTKKREEEAAFATMVDVVGSSPKCAAQYFEVMEKHFEASPLHSRKQQQQEKERDHERDHHEQLGMEVFRETGYL